MKMNNKFAKFLDEPMVKQEKVSQRERTQTQEVRSQVDNKQAVVSAKVYKTTVTKINIIKALQSEKSLAAIIDKALNVYIEQLPLNMQEQLKISGK